VILSLRTIEYVHISHQNARNAEVATNSMLA